MRLIVAMAVVLPLIVPLIWSGYRISVLPDTVLAALSPTEAPWSIRDPLGVWALLLVLAWFGLAYRRRQAGWWELPLVLLAAAVMLPRVGNGWLTGLLLAPPLAVQLARLRDHRVLVLVAVACAAIAVAVTAASRPPSAPDVAPRSTGGAVFADYRWAPDLQRRLPSHTVFGVNGLYAESTDYWLDYLRVVQGHERWSQILQAYDVRVLALPVEPRQQLLRDLVRTAPEWQVVLDDGSGFVAERQR